jgi:hypothetical protein
MVEKSSFTTKKQSGSKGTEFKWGSSKKPWEEEIETSTNLGMRNGKPTVPQAPTGVASVDIDTGVEGETEFTFDGSDSTDPQDSSLTYAWDFKDGTTISGQGATVTHVFDTPDTYNVELSVTNGFEETDTTTVSVIVESGQDVISSDTVLEAGTHDYPNGLLIESGVTVTVNGDTTADANGDYGGVKIVGDGPITIDGTIFFQGENPAVYGGREADNSLTFHRRLQSEYPTTANLY